MLKFIEYISDLLFLHDCVIIPDFGGFICNYKSAYIDDESGLICPPSKDILFNRNLTHNDGLLVSWIAGKENISYEKATSQLMRDLGSIPSPMNCFLLNLGLETLPLRVERHCSNAQKIAEYLNAHEKVSHVNYAGLPEDKYHALAQKYMKDGRTCGVISFELTGGRDAAVRFMDSLKLATIATHVAASITMVLHPASHTHRQMNDEQLVEAGVSPGMIRLSIGIENVDYIIKDLEQALKNA